MSAYDNLIKDFPKRCIKLLEFEREAATKNVEVTLLLAVAGQAIIMPLERLEIKSKEVDLSTSIAHPSADARNFKRFASNISDLLDKSCMSSPLFQDFDSWKYKECRSAEEATGEFVESITPIQNKKCMTIFKILRNALAHGNLRTDGNPISRLIFLSRIGETGKYHRLECTPDALRNLLHAWVQELTKVDLKPDQIVGGNFSCHEDDEDEAA